MRVLSLLISYLSVVSTYENVIKRSAGIAPKKKNKNVYTFIKRYVFAKYNFYVQFISRADYREVETYLS